MIGTDNPAYEPWFSDNKPSNGKGFESAVAYQVAERLGYPAASVTWTQVPFNNAIAPGPKAYDMDINQFSVTAERKQAVDFSSPYYLVRQTVITIKGSKIDGAKTIAELKDAKLGAQVGTTSYQAINDLIKPTTKPQVFNSNDDAKKALQNGTIDGLVVDLPTGFYMTAAELDGGLIVGQLPQVGVPEQFGIVLDKDSPLTRCVSKAVDQLRQDGTLAVLEKTWLAGTGGAPELS
jgi:polar amino acid transport system substrate-binding protein